MDTSLGGDTVPDCAAVDLLAAAPLVSATSLAAGLGMAVNNAAQLLEAFCAAGIAIEVTHRSKRRCSGWPVSRHCATSCDHRTGRSRGADGAAPPLVAEDAIALAGAAVGRR